MALLREQQSRIEFEKVEQEKARLAEELHNDLTPYLASIKMRLSLISGNEIINECLPVLEMCVNQMREISKKMSPMNLYHESFIDALVQFIRKTGIDKTLEVVFIEPDQFEVNSQTSAQLYRILQEIILNCVKHSGAKKLIIELSKNNVEILIRTSDNGIGFEQDKMEEEFNNGTGLLMIKNRLYIMGGTIVKDSSKKTGTRYNIRIPA